MVLEGSIRKLWNRGLYKKYISPFEYELIFWPKNVKIKNDIKIEGRVKMGFFDKLKQGLTKTKESIDEKINNVFSNFRKVDEEFLEELE